MEWTREEMESVRSQLWERQEEEGDLTWDDYQELYELGFNDNGSVNLFIRARVDEYGMPKEDGNYYFLTARLHPSKLRGKFIVTDNDVEDMLDCGKSMWEGNEQEYIQDKIYMQREGRVYMPARPTEGVNSSGTGLQSKLH